MNFRPSQALVASRDHFNGEFCNYLIYYKDGKTASVAVAGNSNFLEIRTNGKTDAALSIAPGHPPGGDEHTMWLLALLPQLHVPAAKNILNIGFGSGLSTQVALGNPGLLNVDSIEIERAMIEGARSFMPLNRLAFEDKRSRIIIDDAKTFLASSGNRYDIIISEPSNPWVSGVASLFTQEYYRVIASKLKPGGVLAQWIQLYDTEPKILASILKALGSEFDDYVMYIVHPGDAVIIASPKGKVPAASTNLFANQGWSDGLARLGYSDTKDFALMRAGDKALLAPLMDSYAIPANSDYFPVVDQLAPLARFKGRSHPYYDELNHPSISLRALSGQDGIHSLENFLGSPSAQGRAGATQRAWLAAETLQLLGNASRPLPREIPQQIRYAVALHHATQRRCDPGVEQLWIESQEAIAVYVAGWVASQDVGRVLELAHRSSACARKLEPLQDTRLLFARGLAERNPKAILDASRILVSQPLDSRYAKENEQVIIAAYVAALAVTGEYDEAIRFVRSHETNPIWQSNLNVRLTLAHIERRVQVKK